MFALVVERVGVQLVTGRAGAERIPVDDVKVGTHGRGGDDTRFRIGGGACAGEEGRNKQFSEEEVADDVRSPLEVVSVFCKERGGWPHDAAAINNEWG